MVLADRQEVSYEVCLVALRREHCRLRPRRCLACCLGAEGIVWLSFLDLKICPDLPPEKEVEDRATSPCRLQIALDLYGYLHIAY